MNIGTNNKLAHLLCEYKELSEQTAMLQSQVQPLTSQIMSLREYISVNGGDRNAVAQLKKSQRTLNTLNNTIRRNMIRLSNLERRINEENIRLINNINGVAYKRQRRIY